MKNIRYYKPMLELLESRELPGNLFSVLSAAALGNAGSRIEEKKTIGRDLRPVATQAHKHEAHPTRIPVRTETAIAQRAPLKGSDQRNLSSALVETAIKLITTDLNAAGIRQETLKHEMAIRRLDGASAHNVRLQTQTSTPHQTILRSPTPLQSTGTTKDAIDLAVLVGPQIDGVDPIGPGGSDPIGPVLMSSGGGGGGGGEQDEPEPPAGGPEVFLKVNINGDNDNGSVVYRHIPLIYDYTYYSFTPSENDLKSLTLEQTGIPLIIQKYNSYVYAPILDVVCNCFTERVCSEYLV